MMDNELTIKVLWIDDQPTEGLMNEALNFGIYIDPRTTVDKGIEALQDRNNLYDAIILDVNCLKHSENIVEESPDIQAFTYAINNIHRLGIKLPYFVYTGENYKGSDALKYIISNEGNWWESKLWYKKPKEYIELFEDIQKAVAQQEDFIIKYEYRNAFNIVSTASTELLDVLKGRHTKDFSTDYNVPVNIRNICENVCDYLLKNGIFPGSYETSNKLKEVSLFFSNDKLFEYVPSYIQALFFFLNSYCNEGCHSQSMVQDEKRITKVRNDIKASKARNLNTVGLVSLLSVMEWISQFPIDNIEEMKPIQTFFLNLYNNWQKANLYEDFEGVIEQDNDGNFHCDKCILRYNDAKSSLGKNVMLKFVKVNTRKETNMKYPYFAGRFELID